MRFLIDASIRLVVTVNNPDAIERVTGPNGDEWRSQCYRLHTVEDVIEHWTYNAVLYGIEDASMLDGWADMDAGEVTFKIEEYNDVTVTPQEIPRG